MVTSLIITVAILGTVTAPGLIAQHLEKRKQAETH